MKKNPWQDVSDAAFPFIKLRVFFCYIFFLSAFYKVLRENECFFFFF